MPRTFAKSWKFSYKLAKYSHKRCCIRINFNINHTHAFIWPTQTTFAVRIFCWILFFMLVLIQNWFLIQKRLLFTISVILLCCFVVYTQTKYKIRKFCMKDWWICVAFAQVTYSSAPHIYSWQLESSKYEWKTNLSNWIAEETKHAELFHNKSKLKMIDWTNWKTKYVGYAMRIRSCETIK